MIDYEVHKWGLQSLFYAHGSVFPKAFIVAFPSALLALLVHYLVNEGGVRLAEAGDVTSSVVVGGYTFILGFLINTRASRAYSRWWEGGTLLQQLRGEWFNAFSSLLAFCSSDPEKSKEVEKFQQLLVRLMSLLYCSGLQQVSTNPAVPPEDFELIDPEGIDLAYLEKVNDKVEVVLQWIQRLIVQNIGNGVLPIAPPILSRVFQEYSRGIVNLNNARKIADFPFPFPLVQCITLMLVMHWLLIPIICGSSLASAAWAGVLTFAVVFSFWCVHFFSFELEMPFGSSSNHLPLLDMQADMNRSLAALLAKDSQTPPAFEYSEDSQADLPICTGVQVLNARRKRATSRRVASYKSSVGTPRSVSGGLSKVSLDSRSPNPAEGFASEQAMPPSATSTPPPEVAEAASGGDALEEDRGPCCGNVGAANTEASSSTAPAAARRRSFEAPAPAAARASGTRGPVSASAGNTAGSPLAAAAATDHTQPAGGGARAEARSPWGASPHRHVRVSA